MFFPVIDKVATGRKIEKIMMDREYTVKDITEYLNISSESVYHWLRGRNLPSNDSLYALSHFFGVPVDDMLCGNRLNVFVDMSPQQYKRLRWYYEKIIELQNSKS